ncbi:MAG: hypothetical protein ACHQJ7_09760, partial [Vicinamibacteria bacterium]
MASRRLALLALAAASFALPAAALSIDAAPAAAAEARTLPITRIVLRLRPGVHPADGARLSGRLLADLRLAVGAPFTVDAPTRMGDQVLALAEPARPAEAKAIVRTLRMRPAVLRADVARASRVPASAVGRLKIADTTTVQRFVVLFEDAATRWASARNQKLSVDYDKMLTKAAGVEMRIVRATAGGAWVVETAAPVSGVQAMVMVKALLAPPGIRYALPDRRVRTHAAYYHPNDVLYQQGYMWNLD